MVERGWKRVLLYALGCVGLTLGVLGILLPVIPGVPFFFVALICFRRSSPRFANALLSNRWIGPRLAEWDRTRRLTWTMRLALVLAVIGLSIGTALSISHLLFHTQAVPLERLGWTAGQAQLAVVAGAIGLAIAASVWVLVWQPKPPVDAIS